MYFLHIINANISFYPIIIKAELFYFVFHPKKDFQTKTFIRNLDFLAKKALYVI